MNTDNFRKLRSNQEMLDQWRTRGIRDDDHHHVTFLVPLSPSGMNQVKQLKRSSGGLDTSKFTDSIF